MEWSQVERGFHVSSELARQTLPFIYITNSMDVADPTVSITHLGPS